MSWKLDFSRDADKQLQKLDKPVIRAALNLFDRLETSEDPRAMGKALTGPLAGHWRYVVHGDWRAIAKIERKVLTIVIVQIAARDKIYK